MKLPREHLPLIVYVCFVLGCLISVEARGGRGGGGRGGGGRGGSGSGGGWGGIARGGGSGVLRKGKIAAIAAGTGAAGYGAARAAHSTNLAKYGGNDGQDSFKNLDQDGNSDHKLREGSAHFGLGRNDNSPWIVLLLMIGTLSIITLGCCWCISLPVSNKDKQKMENNEKIKPAPGMKDHVPLQETPSTATPSPSLV